MGNTSDSCSCRVAYPEPKWNPDSLLELNRQRSKINKEKMARIFRLENEEEEVL
jgi:hypothetical protein